jgi:ribosomal protein S18 acetylase RimI-like enzyme
LTVARLTRLALTVNGDSATAIRLYESPGFRVTAQQMAKPLQ